jgi:hypothetical protein
MVVFPSIMAFVKGQEDIETYGKAREAHGR